MSVVSGVSTWGVAIRGVSIRCSVCGSGVGLYQRSSVLYWSKLTNVKLGSPTRLLLRASSSSSVGESLGDNLGTRKLMSCLCFSLDSLLERGEVRVA